MRLRIDVLTWVLVLFLASGLAGCDDDDTAADECGDGVLDASEECDDGNTEDGDGCNADCEVEQTTGAVCGDEVIEGDEECDDGNTIRGDGCDPRCKTEVVPQEFCGDGIVNGSEECDDGTGSFPLESATCDVDCTDAVCGDNVLNTAAGEECDDGNTAPGDGCDDQCAIQAAGFCGDGIVNNGEDCDGGDGTSPVESATCDIDCTNVVCGDDELNTTAGEECDDGDISPGDGCDEVCVIEFCGDGDVNNGEDCDEGDGTNPVETATCDLDCTDVVCGDSELNTTAGEECDDGDISPGDGCDEVCVIEFCGDGDVNNGEDCDEGDGTSPVESATCDIDCTNVVCGDDVLNATAGEECDDGNLIDDGNGCSDACMRDDKDAFEAAPADDDFTNATLIPVDGTVITGHNLDIATPNTTDDDWYKIDVTDDSLVYEVALSNAACANQDQGTFEITLYDTDGTTELASMEEYGGSDIRFCPVVLYSFSATGTYYIQVDGRLGGGNTTPMGAYDIAVSEATYVNMDASEPANDLYTGATAVSVDGAALTGFTLWEDFDDEDWFVFTVDSTTDLYDIVIDSPTLCAAADDVSLLVDLVDVDGSSVLESRYESGGEDVRWCPRFVWTFPATGDYYLRVSPQVGRLGFPYLDSYSVAIARTAEEATEANDDFTTATPLTLGTPATGNIFFDEPDRDWFSFTVTDQTRTHRVALAGTTDECIKGDARRLMFDINDTDGTTVIIDDAQEGDTPPYCAEFDVLFTAPGTYYVKVYPFYGGAYADNSWGYPFDDYSITVSEL